MSGPVLYTVTAAITPEGEMWFPIRVPGGARAGTVAIAGGVELFRLEDGSKNAAPSSGISGVAATSAIHDVGDGSPGFIFTGSSGTTYWVRSADATFTPAESTGDVGAAIADRDAEWVDALTAEWPVKP